MGLMENKGVKFALGTGIVIFFINVLTKGWAWEQIKTTFANPNLAKDALCGLGIAILSPVERVGNMWIPSLSIWNAIIVTIISFGIIFILRVLGKQWKLRYTLLIFVLVFLVMKIIGLILVLTAGDTCMTLLLSGSRTIGSLVVASGAAGIFYMIYRIFRGKVI